MSSIFERHPTPWTHEVNEKLGEFRYPIFNAKGGIICVVITATDARELVQIANGHYRLMVGAKDVLNFQSPETLIPTMFETSEKEEVLQYAMELKKQLNKATKIMQLYDMICPGSPQEQKDFYKFAQSMGWDGPFGDESFEAFANRMRREILGYKNA